MHWFWCLITFIKGLVFEAGWLAGEVLKRLHRGLRCQNEHHYGVLACVSFGGQAPRWYPRFTLGDLFATTLIVKWPGASFGGLAPRWYPRFSWAVQEKNKEKSIHSGPGYKQVLWWHRIDIENPSKSQIFCVKSCIPITASPCGGRAGGDSVADIQMTQKIHQTRVFSTSIPCTPKTYLWQRSLCFGGPNYSDRCHK